MGPSSSGNRMMQRAITSTKDFGEGGVIGEGYVLRKLWLKGNDLVESLKTAPDKIVYGKSIPSGSYHNPLWYHIKDTCNLMIANGYLVCPIVMHREPKFVILSQVRHQHVRTGEDAVQDILRAYQHIFEQLSLIPLFPIIVKYEDFVTSDIYRNWLFSNLGLPKSTLKLYNANDAY